jgi:hypothetical protein
MAFISSIKRVNWEFDFDNFLEQDNLMNDYLFKFEDQIRNIDKNSSIIEQGALLWNCIYYVLSQYLSENDSLISVRHEDICYEPIITFRNLFESLNINFTDEIKKSLSGFVSANKVEAENNKVHDLHRNSKNLAKVWKERLTEEEIKYIKAKTYKLASKFYNDSSWD